MYPPLPHHTEVSLPQTPSAPPLRPSLSQTQQTLLFVYCACVRENTKHDVSTCSVQGIKHIHTAVRPSAPPSRNFSRPENRKSILSPGWGGSVDGALARKPKGRRFNPQSGHMPGLWVRSHSRGPMGGNHTSMFLSLSLLSPLSKHKQIIFFEKEKEILHSLSRNPPVSPPPAPGTHHSTFCLCAWESYRESHMSEITQCCPSVTRLSHSA